MVHDRPPPDGMPPASAKPITALALYVAIIGTALAGLLGILRVGSRLTPPPAVGGVWRLAIDHQAGAACARLLPLDATALTILQSGVHVLFRFDGDGGAVFDGRLQGTAMTGRARAAAAGAGAPTCPADARATLEMRLDPTAAPPRLTGALRAPACAGCAAVVLRATRIGRAAQ